MSPTPATVRGYESTGKAQFERRAHQRYPIMFDVEYMVPNGNGVGKKGFGRTINISSHGVLLDIDAQLPNRCPIQLSIPWPFLLDQSIQLKLFLYGNIVRVLSNRIAVRVTGHTFITTGRATQ